MTKKNVIIFSDMVHPVSFTRSYGPYALKGFLRTSAPDFEVRIFDAFSKRPLEYWSNLLRSLPSVDYVLFSTTFWVNLKQMVHQDSLYTPSWWFNDDVNEFFDFCSRLKAEYGCKIIVGGHKSSDVYASLKGSPDLSKSIDVLVVGHAETVLTRILRSQPVELNSVKKLYHTKVIKGTKQNEFELGDKNYQPYYDEVILPGESLMVENSRGCIYKCKFCFYPLNNRKADDKFLITDSSLAADLKINYERYGTVDYIINDDTFNDNIKKLRKFVSVIQELPFYDKLRFTCNLRIDNVNAEQAKLLDQARIIACLSGVESIDSAISKSVGKGKLTQSALIAGASTLKEYAPNIKFTGSFIVGLPGASVDLIERTAEFINQHQNLFDGVEFDPLYVFNPEYAEYDFSSTYQLAKEFTFEPGTKLGWINPDTPFGTFRDTVPHVSRLLNMLTPNLQDTIKVFARTHLGNGFQDKAKFRELMDKAKSYTELREALRVNKMPSMWQAKQDATNLYFKSLESTI